MHGIALSDAKVGTEGVVEWIDLPAEVSHYLAHLGFLPGTSVEVLRRAPAGDPRVYRIDGVEVGLRNETAKHIFLAKTSKETVGSTIEAEISQKASTVEPPQPLPTLRLLSPWNKHSLRELAGTPA